MPVPLCTLTVYRPTETTVKFTVSTRSPRTTTTAKILHYSLIVIRLLLGSFIFLLLWSKWNAIAVQEDRIIPPIWLLDSLPWKTATIMSSKARLPYILPLAFLSGYILLWKGYTGINLGNLPSLHRAYLPQKNRSLSCEVLEFKPSARRQPMSWVQRRASFQPPTSRTCSFTRASWALKPGSTWLLRSKMKKVWLSYSR